MKDYNATSTIEIQKSIRDDNKNKLIVFCKNHDRNTYIMIENHPLTTRYSDSSLSCTIPPEYWEKEIPFCLINEKNEDRTEIRMVPVDSTLFSVIACGFGGEAIWITCVNHSWNTQLFFEDQHIRTIYYPDHLVGILPERCKTQDTVRIKIADKRKKQELLVLIKR